MRAHPYLTAFLLVASSCRGAESVVTGAGSTAAQPLYSLLARAYAGSGGPRFEYQAIGSSAGIEKIRQRAVDFGATDVALDAEQRNKDKLICFPSAISGVVPVVSVPGIRPGELQLTGELLAGIFSRRIVKWNDPALAAANPGLRLPNLPIAVVVRLDGSGTTYNFTDYLSKASPQWRTQYGRDFKIAWPAGTVAVKGSAEVAAAVTQTQGAIAYIDFKYVGQAGLAYAKLRNHDGKFVAPGAAGFAAALKSSAWASQAKYEDMLTDQAGEATWPITMGTFVLVPQVTAAPEHTIAALKFFMWSFVHGDRLVEEASFVRLPDKVQGRIFAEVTKITDREGRPLRWSLTSVLQAKP